MAQGLRSDGVAVEVFERDYSPSDRLQGYRLGINAAGSKALRACLPHALFEKLIASSAKPSRRVGFLDHRLNRLPTIDLPQTNRTGVENDRPVSRIALRRILLEGLDHIVHFGNKSSPSRMRPAAPSPLASRMDRKRQEMCWLVPMAPALVCGASFCRMPSGSRRGS